MVNLAAIASRTCSIGVIFLPRTMAIFKIGAARGRAQEREGGLGRARAHGELWEARPFPASGQSEPDPEIRNFLIIRSSFYYVASRSLARALASGAC